VTRDFHGFVRGNVRVDFPATNTEDSPRVNRERTAAAALAVERALRDDPDGIVGIIVEPLQGAGGHRTAEPDFYRRLSQLAHDYGVFLGIDEVQTAGGQTGTFFAADQFDLPYAPQAIAAAKKMACGVVYMLHPMEDRGVLDSTWGGTLADMVRFVQEMRIVEREGLIEAVPAKTARLTAALHDLASVYSELVYNVRGMGLYQGFSLRRAEDAPALVNIARDHEHLLLLKAGSDSIRLRPSLSVTDDDISEFASRLGASLDRLRLASSHTDGPDL